MPFEKGVSGNAAGRPTLSSDQRAENEKLRDAYRKLSKKALKLLHDEFICCPSCRKELRLKAAAIVLRHGFGNHPILQDAILEPVDNELRVVIVSKQKREENEDFE